MTAPNGIEIRIVGIRVTLVMNQACSMNSRSWNLVVNTALVTSTTIAAISPGPRTMEATESATRHTSLTATEPWTTRIKSRTCSYCVQVGPLLHQIQRICPAWVTPLRQRRAAAAWNRVDGGTEP